jgi:hypothetical protein
LRWEFDHPDGRVRRAARAVDTATHPDAQGRGVFRALTMHALDALAADGSDFVFNTPNDKSRPGYLAMGWSTVGRVPIGVRVTRPTALFRIASSRVAADRFAPEHTRSDRLTVHDIAGDADLAALLAELPSPSGLRTRRSVGYLTWRYGHDRLGYQAVVAPGGVREGVAVFRSRPRGAAREVALCEVLSRAGDRIGQARLVRAAQRAGSGDYVLSAGRSRHGFVPLPRLGPILTYRGLQPDPTTAASRADPAPGRWDLGLGDIELF